MACKCSEEVKCKILQLFLQLIFWLCWTFVDMNYLGHLQFCFLYIHILYSDNEPQCTEVDKHSNEAYFLWYANSAFLIFPQW